MRARTQHSGRIEVEGGLRAIQAAVDAYRAVWASACKRDGVPADSRFVVFSRDNPFTPFIDSAFREIQERKREYRTGGYVGLVIGK